MTHLPIKSAEAIPGVAKGRLKHKGREILNPKHEILNKIKPENSNAQGV
jgi:hypothetical protein